jgi:hypothetical protein
MHAIRQTLSPSSCEHPLSRRRRSLCGNAKWTFTVHSPSTFSLVSYPIWRRTLYLVAGFTIISCAQGDHMLLHSLGYGDRGREDSCSFCHCIYVAFCLYVYLCDCGRSTAGMAWLGPKRGRTVVRYTVVLSQLLHLFFAIHRSAGNIISSPLHLS